jgi:predicted amidohydrolase
MRVATLQTCPVFRDKKANLANLAKLVIQAAEGGAKLVVMPELATSGYSYMNRNEALEDAEVISFEASNTMRVMQALSQKYNVHLVWGMLERDPGSGKLYNSQVYLEPGNYYEKYSKVNQWGNDFLWCSPGIANPPVITAEGLGGLRVGLLICRDVRDKKDSNWKNFYSSGDADVVCLSSNWGKGGFPSNSWMDFVADNKCSLIVSNRYGQEEHNDFGFGGVCIISKSGEVNCEGLVWRQDCIVYGEV